MSKGIQGLKNIPYEAKLKELNWHFLERCSLRGDLIEVHKWYKSYNKGDISKFLKVNNQGRTRNIGLKNK